MEGEKMLKKKEKQHIVANEKAITLIALVVTMIVPYDKMKECGNM